MDRWLFMSIAVHRYDCPLSEKGHAEAAAAGALLKEEGISLFL